MEVQQMQAKIDLNKTINQSNHKKRLTLSTDQRFNFGQACKTAFSFLMCLIIAARLFVT
jgi:hypothetical protein